jgi:large subunit ribosomal protein L25
MAAYVDAKEALSHFHKGEKVFQIDLDGKSQTVLLKGLQFDYLGTNVVHADLARVDLNERVSTRVPIHLVGEAIGLKTAGAILTHPTGELDVECRVADIPDSIEVSVTDLDVGGLIHARDVTLPEGIKLLSDDDAIVAAITVVAEQASGEAVPAEGTATGVQPEVQSEKKAAERADKKDTK